MMYVVYTVITILLLLLFYSIHIYIRIDKVARLQILVSDATYNNVIAYVNSFTTDKEFLLHYKDYLILRHEMEILRDKYSFDRMLYSFKPLTLEKWYTKEEIELINKYKAY